jgi:nitrogen regulatory protein P-II 1
VKKIEAIIRPDRVGVVRAAITEAGYSGITITEVRGHGIQKGIAQQYRGVSYTTDILPKAKLEVVVPDGSVKKLVTAIMDAARTGNIGDGKIFVSTVDEVYRVRTGESGDKAL